MQGLILKDIYVIGKSCRNFFLMDIIFIAAYFLGGGNIFFLFYPCIFSGMLPMTLISFEERDCWDKYACSLPLTKAQMVSSKYIIGLCFSFIVLSFITVIQALNVIKGSMSMNELFISIAVMGAVSIIVPAVLFPWVFKFGVERGRIFYYFTIGISCALSFIVADMEFGHKVGMPVNLPIYFIIFAAAILIYIASWALSIKFYKTREL